MSNEMSDDKPPKNNGPAVPWPEGVRKKFDDIRGWIIMVAILVASVTYTSGLNPPGGFWRDDNGDHKFNGFCNSSRQIAKLIHNLLLCQCQCDHIHGFIDNNNTSHE
jgi:Domain of unknown function